MTDLEITKLCAQAMGYSLAETDSGYWRIKDGKDVIGMIGEGTTILRKYDPLHDDAQAMALVKRFNLLTDKVREANPRWAVHPYGNFDVMVYNHDYNRAICLCVAKMREGA